MNRLPYLLTTVLLFSLNECTEGNQLDDLLLGETDALYCYGNPDSSIICVPKADVWDCEAMPNGEVKCLHTPDGQPDWSCLSQGDQAVCSKASADAMGGAGWDCLQEETITTCRTVGNSDGSGNAMTPPAGGSWTCITDERGISCTSSDAGQVQSGGSEQIVGPGPAGSSGGTPQTPPKPRAGDFRTQTPGGWGAPGRGNNPGAYRDAHFAETFTAPQFLTIGCSTGATATFTSAKAIEAFLPAGGTPGVLDQNANDPLATSAGVLAGHVVALSLAVGFDRKFDDFGASAIHLEHLVATSGTCKGMTVKQILQLANNVVGGCSKQLSPSKITGCVDAINNTFVDGERAGSFLAFP